MSEINPSKIATFCEPILKQFIGFPIKITPESSNDYERRYSLNSGINDDFTTPSIAISDRSNYPLKVFPLSLKSEIKENFWLHFSILFNVEVFQKKAKYLFDGVSIQVFRGISTDENKDLLFRAEWDTKSGEDNKIHPHPHWHIHFVKEKIPSKITENFEAFLELADYDTKGFLNEDKITQKTVKEFNISKFHFAMGATWTPNINDKHELTEKDLKSWLFYTLKHIKEQIEYAAS